MHILWIYYFVSLPNVEHNGDTHVLYKTVYNIGSHMTEYEV